MRIPIKNLLRRQSQARLAELQDEAVDIVYSLCPNAVLHGGTGIWRCFQGNRFSEDLDFYAIVKNRFREELELELKKRSLALTKFRKTKNVVFAKISGNYAEAPIQISLRKSPEKIPSSFERVDGSFVEIFSLSAEGFVAEKALAFLGRKFVRDLYDVFFLLTKIEDFEKARPVLEELAEKFLPPIDEKNLKTLIFSGIVPTSRQMIEKIKRAVSK